MLFQIPDLDALSVDTDSIADCATAVAWSQVDGAVAILTAVGAASLHLGGLTAGFGK